MYTDLDDGIEKLLTAQIDSTEKIANSEISTS